MTTESLICQTDKAPFTREITKGRKPHHCEIHAAEIAAEKLAKSNTVDGVQTLTCEFDGHPFSRPVKRGKLPRFCPDHKATVAAFPASVDSSPVTLADTQDSVSVDLNVDSEPSVLRPATNEDVLRPSISGAARADRLFEMMQNLPRMRELKRLESVA